MRYTDGMAQRLLIFTIIATLVNMFSQLGYDAIAGKAGMAVHISCWALNTVNTLARCSIFGFASLFLDYSIHANYARLKKMGILVAAFFSGIVAALAFNLFSGFMFSITPDNFYADGPLHLIPAIPSCSLLLFTLVSALIGRGRMNRDMFILALISVLPALAGEVIANFAADMHINNSLVFVSLMFAFLFMVRRNALIDDLTGIHNRRGCDEYLLVLGGDKRRQSYSFIMIDMDRFKEINDAFGHAQGDIALRDVANVLRSSVRSADFVARYGGDEFVVIAAGQETATVTERILNRLAEFNEKGNRPIPLALSCGGGLYQPDDARTPQEFLSYVDGLMYAQKNERRAGNPTKALVYHLTGNNELERFA